MKKLLFKSIATVLFLALLVQACKKGDFEQLELDSGNAEFAFPLFNSTLNVADLVNNIVADNAQGDTIIFNPDKTITLFYAGDVAEKKATDIFTFFQNAIIPVDSAYFEVPFQAPNGVTVKVADLKTGTLTSFVKNNLTEKITGKFYIPQLKKNGEIYSRDFELEPGANIIFPQIDLEGWSLSAVDNRITFLYDAYLPDGTKVERLPALAGVPAVVVSIQNLTFYYLEGYWGKVTYDLTTDTIEIDINQTNLTGNVQVKNPKIAITIFNSYGFPTRGLVDYVRFQGKDGDWIELESPLILAGTETGIDFNYPSFAAGEIGQTKSTVFAFDETNSNIEAIFNSEPTRMIYKVTGLANAEEDPNLVGFLTDSSTIRMNVKVELLLEGQLQDFGADQTLDLDFGALADSTGFESAEFKLVTENRMPFTTALQIYFQDVNGASIDSLFADGAQQVLRAAPVDAGTGLTTGETRTETFIPFTGVRFENLRKNGKKALMHASFSTAENGSIPVKILSDQGAVIKMGVRLKR